MILANFSLINLTESLTYLKSTYRWNQFRNWFWYQFQNQNHQFQLISKSISESQYFESVCLWVAETENKKWYVMCKCDKVFWHVFNQFQNLSDEIIMSCLICRTFHVLLFMTKYLVTLALLMFALIINNSWKSTVFFFSFFLELVFFSCKYQISVEN